MWFSAKYLLVAFLGNKVRDWPLRTEKRTSSTKLTTTIAHIIQTVVLNLLHQLNQHLGNFNVEPLNVINMAKALSRSSTISSNHDTMSSVYSISNESSFYGKLTTTNFNPTSNTSRRWHDQARLRGSPPSPMSRFREHSRLESENPSRQESETTARGLSQSTKTTETRWSDI